MWVVPSILFLVALAFAVWQHNRIKSLQRTVAERSRVSEHRPTREASPDALFATLSHELKTPLNGLLGIVQMLREERQDEDLQAIEGCAQHMLAVIGTLVNLTKIQEEWEDLPQYREWISLYEITEQVKKQISFRASLRGLKIELLHQDTTTRLRGDYDHLKTIIETAILGSLESVSLLELPKEKKTLRVIWETHDNPEGRDVRIAISNPLETISDDREDRIRGAFRMTAGESHSRIPMEYLYWAVSSALLEKYHGVQYASAMEGGGASSVLTFEMEQMQASPTDKRPIGGLRLESPDGAQPKAARELPVRLSVLVAEDDPIARSLMSTVLKLMGQEVHFALNGREVLDLVSHGDRYDLILMDIDMPVMDGVSCAIALRNGESGKTGTTIPIVAVTAFNTLSDEGKFKKAGMNYFLPKPVKLANLRSVLLEVINQDKNIAEV